MKKSELRTLIREEIGKLNEDVWIDTDFPARLDNVEYAIELKGIWQDLVDKLHPKTNSDMNRLKKKFKDAQVQLASDKTNAMFAKKYGWDKK